MWWVLVGFLVGLSGGGADRVYKVGYYDLPVDHFGFTTNVTFGMRFLYNDTWWDRDNGGPIFFYTGNEGDIELFAENSGFLWEIAPEFKALVVFAEHRYYGKSLPFGPNAFSGPSTTGYLTSEQALADFAEFLLFYKFHHGGTTCPIIAFGGSYGGMLSAWMRIKYPHVVQGAIAASAPLFQFTDLTPCETFARILTSAYARESAECVDTVRKSWAALTEFGTTVAGRDWLTKNWRLCDPLKGIQDLTNLKEWLNDVYGNLAMANYPYPANFLNPLPPNPVKVFCSKLNPIVKQGKDLLRSLFKGLGVYFNYTGTADCLNVKESASVLLGDRGWDYQACTEMVMPMCSDGVNDMLEPTVWDYKAFAKDCGQRWWGLAPRPWMTQIIYGGKNILQASNIVFSNGLLDPWSGGGVLMNLSDTLVSVVIPEGAHHLDLRQSNPADPPSVVAARKLEVASIHQWIREYKRDRYNNN